LRVLTEKLTGELDIPKGQNIYEPFGKNTAPAVGLVCLLLERLGKSGEVVGIFPADHLVEEEEKFHKICQLGAEVALKGEIVTLGMKPTYPATGYGYIELTGSVVQEDSSGNQAITAKGFREKPDESTAKDFIDSGNFVWNGGMFIFKVSTMIERFKEYQPELWKTLDSLHKDQNNLKEVYDKAQGISIDYAIMEKLSSHVCIPCDVGWSDLGSWEEMAKTVPTHSKTLNIGGEGNFALGDDEKHFAFVGVSDLIAVDTDDALLITKSGNSQRVGEIVDTLQKQGERVATDHPFEFRPWGSFEILKDRDNFKSKRIVVEPGQQLSYQSHQKRSEFWVIVSGSAEVVLNDKSHLLKAGESIHIPQGAKHRMRNTTSTPIEFVEVQLGSYFGEDDIIRFEDDYNRA
jgi:mannose-1-phosphate guanylyltransferase/mannose-1-phosphate guanylyltransferase/mannose-6-phosphate isomerase